MCEEVRDKVTVALEKMNEHYYIHKRDHEARKRIKSAMNFELKFEQTNIDARNKHAAEKRAEIKGRLDAEEARKRRACLVPQK